MSILINKETKLMVYGMTGQYGTAQVKAMQNYGTQVVAGISVGKGGQTHLGIPLCDTAKEAVKRYGANTAALYIPNPAIPNAIAEALSVQTKLIFIPTEGIPIHEFMVYKKKGMEKNCWIVGPNSLGLISPGQSLVGSVAPEFTAIGPIGVISRSGTLTLETISYMSECGYGQTTVISMGGDNVIGRNPVDYMKEFNQDSETKAVVMLSEIGGMKDYEVCDYMPQMNKPVVAYVGGRVSREGKRMGHMGALVNGERETAKSKNTALKAAGVYVANTPWEIPEILAKLGL